MNLKKTFITIFITISLFSNGFSQEKIEKKIDNDLFYTLKKEIELSGTIRKEELINNKKISLILDKTLLRKNEELSLFILLNKSNEIIDLSNILKNEIYLQRYLNPNEKTYLILKTNME
jgi:hypothetical protein